MLIFEDSVSILLGFVVAGALQYSMVGIESFLSTVRTTLMQRRRSMEKGSTRAGCSRRNHNTEGLLLLSIRIWELGRFQAGLVP